MLDEAQTVQLAADMAILSNGASAREAVEPRIRALGIRELLEMEIPARDPILETLQGKPLLFRQDSVMMHAKRGVGKTHFALGLALAISSGGTFLRYRALKPRCVLYLDGELPLATIQRRMAELQATSEKEPPDGHFRIVTPDYQRLPLPNLATPFGQEALAPLLEGVEVLILDSLSVLASYGRENESESWTPVQEWVLSLRRKGMSVILLHHSGKSGQQRGTSRREDILDLVINLAHPSDYEPSQGARFVVSFEKTRGNLGDAAKSFEAQLLADGRWSTKDTADLNLARAIEMRDQKMSIREVAEELGMSRSAVHRMLAKESK
jgi:putative DNA primase/helicase